ncbi:hypothetical protein JZ751_017443 [Albula glossodonta]|uniref:Type-1 angiotensin II receptor-associated protein n=1 Tax=Albula glossodonta TaxID=121402 RepID=A0A8T2PP07_9TELE|nr:hypothetical protein JZ751_017443 [Albula glossodonta]
MEIPAINLKAIVLVHWLLTIWGCMELMPSSYAWGNFSVLAVGVWAIAQRDSIDAVLMFLIGMALTVVTDIVHFGVFYPVIVSIKESDTQRFCMGMAILSLLLKPASCFFVYQMYRERGGDYNVNFDVYLKKEVSPLLPGIGMLTNPSTTRTSLALQATHLAKQLTPNLGHVPTERGLRDIEGLGEGYLLAD